MTAELSIRKDGFVEHAYSQSGGVGWTGLGNELREGASIDEWVNAAGMDWRILRSKVRYSVDRDPAVPLLEMDEKHVLFRSDTKMPLSVVSDGYEIVQPRATVEFFRDLTEKAGFKMETAGVLFKGKRFWAMARVGEDAVVGKGDRISPYLLLSTSCDGSLATEARFTAVRVVCNNTLSCAITGNAGARVTHRSVFRAEEVKSDLGVSCREQFAETMNSFRDLASKQLAPSEAVQMTAELIKPGIAKLAIDEQKKVLESRGLKLITGLALEGRAKGSQFEGTDGTAYGWLNAVTEYVDHHIRARSADNRQNSAWFGPGDSLKTRAFELALAA